MSVIIEGMEMPKGCNDCPLKVQKFINEITDFIDLCPYTQEVIIKDKYTNKKCKDCPLKEYPENKDMSWKELIEKIKKIKFVCLGKNKRWFYIAFSGYAIEFHNDGTIFLSCEHSFNLFENKKPFEMWQIIKALVGEK